MTHTCIGCGKTPAELPEYISMAEVEETTPEQAMIENEGTFDRFERDRFYCTTCYIKAGMPLLPKRRPLN